MSNKTNAYHLNLRIEEGGGDLTIRLRDGALVERKRQATDGKKKLKDSVQRYESPFEPVAKDDWRGLHDDSQ